MSARRPTATAAPLDPAADRAHREAVAADGAMRVKDACAFVGLGATEIYALIKDGTLPSALLGTGGRRRVIPKAALVKYLADRLELGATR